MVEREAQSLGDHPLGVAHARDFRDHQLQDATEAILFLLCKVLIQLHFLPVLLLLHPLFSLFFGHLVGTNASDAHLARGFLGPLVDQRQAEARERHDRQQVHRLRACGFHPLFLRPRLLALGRVVAEVLLILHVHGAQKSHHDHQGLLLDVPVHCVDRPCCPSHEAAAVVLTLQGAHLVLFAQGVRLHLVAFPREASKVVGLLHPGVAADALPRLALPRLHHLSALCADQLGLVVLAVHLAILPGIQLLAAGDRLVFVQRTDILTASRCSCRRHIVASRSSCRRHIVRRTLVLWHRLQLQQAPGLALFMD
mmetsp:Transcript_17103/g.40477  ORF Transcript_17103/g.40477 Transcript_17103/m.40477 type:complete len:310 (-) Transcript_17103:242-1171(-)